MLEVGMQYAFGNLARVYDDAPEGPQGSPRHC